MLDSNIHYPEQYLGEVNYYYACIFGPFKPYVLAGLDKIKDLPVEMVCPSHGPCLVEGISRIQGLYREWSTPAAPSGKKVVGILQKSTPAQWMRPRTICCASPTMAERSVWMSA